MLKLIIVKNARMVQFMNKFICFLVFIFCFSTAYAEKSMDLLVGIPYKSASWKSKTTIKSPEETVAFEQTVFLKGKKTRTEGQFLNRATNEKENQITIITETMMYSINTDKKQGMKYSLNSPNNPAKAAAETNKCRENAKKSGTENINSEKCDKYEYTCKFGGNEMKITEYRNSSGFSVKTVSNIGGTTTTSEISELKIDASIPDSKFVPDKNIKFMDMDSIMKDNMKKAMDAMKKAETSEDDNEDSGQKMMKDMMKNMMGQ